MSVAPDEKIDWFSLFVDLGENGYSLRAISAAVMVPVPTLHGWKQGASPKYEEGERFIDLWLAVTGNVRESVRTVKRHSYLA